MSSPFNNARPAWQQPVGDFSPANIYQLRYGETPMNAARNGRLGGGQPEMPRPAIHLISTPSSSPSMFSSLKATIRRKKS
ncbi:hypothetical protein V492_08221, partial [Pseudogymnoascus sp. VKM F-4246]